MTTRRARQSEFARAVSMGEVDAVREMIADGIDVTYVDEHDNTPLALAQLHRRGTIERMLLAAGALPLDLTPVPGGPTLSDAKRLLARLKRTRASLRIPTDPPDRTLGTILRGGRISGSRLILRLEERLLPRGAAATRRALLEAYGYEALRWLKHVKIVTQGEFRVGTAHPWYTLVKRSAAQARRIVAMIGR